jgi:hypothetical protein
MYLHFFPFRTAETFTSTILKMDVDYSQIEGSDQTPTVRKLKGLPAKGFINFHWGTANELFLFPTSKGAIQKKNVPAITKQTGTITIYKWRYLLNETKKVHTFIIILSYLSS